MYCRLSPLTGKLACVMIPIYILKVTAALTIAAFPFTIWLVLFRRQLPSPKRTGCGVAA